METRETMVIDMVVPPEGGMSFEEFYALTEELAKNGVATPDYPEEKIKVIKLNLARMKRTMKQIEIPEELKEEFMAITKPMRWVVLSEPWCMDAVNLLPLMWKISQLNPLIELQVFLRDKHPELMDRYLTEGTRSIPKIVCFTEDLDELGHWGPRPELLTHHVKELKDLSGLAGDDLKARIQVWYNQDKGESFLHEFRKTVSNWK